MTKQTIFLFLSFFLSFMLFGQSNIVNSNPNSLNELSHSFLQSSENINNSQIKYVAQNNTIVLTTDTDGDGVNDVIDLDDDNDGILDIEEYDATTLAANIFLNGSLEGSSNGTSLLPNSWQSVPFNNPICEADTPGRATPDLLDVDGPTRITGIYGIPQDGSTFVSGLYQSLGSGIFFHEGIEQDVNLISGTTYTVSFYQSNVGQNTARDGTGIWRVFLQNQQLFESSATIPNTTWSNINLTWDLQSFTFTAVATGIQTIRFLPYDDDTVFNNRNAVRLGIDNIKLIGSTVTVSDDVDQDSISNALDLDSDNDGISDLQESGINALVFDADLNGVIDGPAFVDLDNDGLADGIESIYGQNTGVIPVESFLDLDDLQDFIDLDSDGDTIPDSVESQITLNYVLNFLNDGNVTNDDSDGDGIIDLYDINNTHGGNFNRPQNTEGLDEYDYLDLDSDNDGLFDIAEVGNTILDTNNNGASNTLEGLNGMTDSLEASDDFNDPNFLINDPTALLDVDLDVLSGGDVDYRDFYLTVNVTPNSSICAGFDGVFNITGTNNSLVSYSLNGGVALTIQLDAFGSAVLPIVQLLANVTISLIDVSYLSFSSNISSTATLTVNQNPIAQLGNDLILCEGEIFILDATTTNATYLWQDNSINETFTVTQSGTYAVEITVNGCSTLDAITILYEALPVLYRFSALESCSDINSQGDFNLLQSSSNILSNQAFVEASFFTSFSDAETNINEINSPGNYISTAGTIYVRLDSNQAVCFTIGEFELTVKDCEITIPQGISPNEDGKNEELRIVNIDNYPNHTVAIFNRYGKNLYNGNSATNKWNGIYKGRKLPVGTYFYLLNLNEPQLTETIKQIYQGWIYLNY